MKSDSKWDVGEIVEDLQEYMAGIHCTYLSMRLVIDSIKFKVQAHKKLQHNNDTRNDKKEIQTEYTWQKP